MHIELPENIDHSTPLFSISVAARMLDISVHTLRMYEKEGLILPNKEEGHYRLYSQNDIDRLQCIRRAIREKKFSIASIKAIFSFIPCWKLINCPVSDRESCEAFTNTEKPCWSYNHKDNICANLDCRDCEVYNNFTECHQIKREINKLLGEQ